MANTDTGLSPASSQGLARALGWFSIGLGVSELIAPQSVCSALGMPGREKLVQAYGLRELASGMGILASNNPTPWVWSRVGGDALDLATLSDGLSDSNPKKGNVRAAIAAVSVITVLDLACAGSLETKDGKARGLTRDYSDRVGLPLPPDAMRGAASDAYVPPDMRTPKAMRYTPRVFPGIRAPATDQIVFVVE
jgi:hypothetical protein